MAEVSLFTRKMGSKEPKLVTDWLISVLSHSQCNCAVMVHELKSIAESQIVKDNKHKSNNCQNIVIDHILCKHIDKQS